MERKGGTRNPGEVPEADEAIQGQARGRLFADPAARSLRDD